MPLNVVKCIATVYSPAIGAQLGKRSDDDRQLLNHM